MKRLSYLFFCFVLSVVVFSCDKEDKIVPVISNLEIDPVAPKPGEAVTVKATVTTPEGAPVTVGLEYKVNNGSPSNVSMSNGGSGNVYSGIIPASAQIYEAKIDYTVSASNKHGEAEEISDNYTIASESEFRPDISNPTRTPESPDPGEPVVISATVTSPEGTTNLTVVLKWKVDDDDMDDIPMSNGGSGNVFTATIPGQGQSGNGAVVSYTISATNNVGTTTNSSSYTIPEIDLSKLKLNEVNGFDNEKWFEIYNTGDVAINLEGVEAWYDNASVGYRLSWTGKAEDVIPAKGWFATPRGEDSNLGTGLSANNVNVKLQLRAPNGEVLDTYQKTAGFTPTEAEYPHLRHKAHARIPDGTGDWYYLDNSEGTPNATNGTSTEGFTKFGEEEPIDLPPPPDDVDYSPLMLTEICGSMLFVEIYNSGDVDIPMASVRLQRNDGESEWVGTTEDEIPAGEYRLILFRNGNIDSGDAPESHLKQNPTFVGWTISSGLSNQQFLKIAIVDPTGIEVSTFIRGDADQILLYPWGSPPNGSGITIERPGNYANIPPFGNVRPSYTRLDDGTWVWASHTPGAPNINLTNETPIVNPGYLTAQP